MVGVVGSSPIAPTTGFRQHAPKRSTERHGYDTANAQGSRLETASSHRSSMEKCGSAAFFLFPESAMPKITLPNGAVKGFDVPVTVADVAAAIGPGLAKAALAGKLDGRLVDTSELIERDAALAI